MRCGDTTATTSNASIPQEKRPSTRRTVLPLQTQAWLALKFGADIVQMERMIGEYQIVTHRAEI